MTSFIINRRPGIMLRTNVNHSDIIETNDIPQSPATIQHYGLGVISVTCI